MGLSGFWQRDSHAPCAIPLNDVSGFLKTCVNLHCLVPRTDRACLNVPNWKDSYGINNYRIFIVLLHTHRTRWESQFYSLLTCSCLYCQGEQ